MEILNKNSKDEFQIYQRNIKELLMLFNVHNINDLTQYLKEIDNTTNVCAKQVKGGN